MAIRHREVFPVGSSPDSIQWDIWNDDHVGDAAGLPQDQIDALDGANAPDGSNPFATMADMASGGGGGLAIYGDASDGNVAITGPTYPTLVGVAAWLPTTAYAVGDVVKSTGTHVRAFKCKVAGTSGGADPFTDATAGKSSRRDTTIENNAQTCRPIWEQETVVVEGVVEGNIYAESLTISDDLICQGWILYATDTLTLEAGNTISADGESAVDENGVPMPSGTVTAGRSGGLAAPIFGLGQTGSDAGVAGIGAVELITVGRGGEGGDGADGPGGLPYDTAFGYRGVRALPSLLSRTVPLPGVGGWNVAKAQRTAFGGAGGSSDGANPGGGGGEGGAPLVLFAKNLVLAGILSSVGGDGAPGDAGGNTGGGGGAQGGTIILLYNVLDETLATYDVSGGLGGLGQGTGTDGGDGSPGAVIKIPNA